MGQVLQQSLAGIGWKRIEIGSDKGLVGGYKLGVGNLGVWENRMQVEGSDRRMW